MAAWVPDMFCNFYLMKKFCPANNSIITEAREKVSSYLESSEFQKIFDACFTNFKINQILRNIMSHKLLVTAKPFAT